MEPICEQCNTIMHHSGSKKVEREEAGKHIIEYHYVCPNCESSTVLTEEKTIIDKVEKYVDCLWKLQVDD